MLEFGGKRRAESGLSNSAISPVSVGAAYRRTLSGYDLPGAGCRITDEVHLSRGNCNIIPCPTSANCACKSTLRPRRMIARSGVGMG